MDFQALGCTYIIEVFGRAHSYHLSISNMKSAGIELINIWVLKITCILSLRANRISNKTEKSKELIPRKIWFRTIIQIIVHSIYIYWSLNLICFKNLIVTFAFPFVRWSFFFFFKETWIRSSGKDKLWNNKLRVLLISILSSICHYVL